MSFWGDLGIEPTTDKAVIRHAYAEKTRTCHPEEEPERFDRLHTAFTAAMQYARRNAGTATVMETQPMEAAGNTAEPAEGDFLYTDADTEKKAQHTQTRRSAKERYARGKANREERQKSEQRALEEYLSQAQRQSRQQIELGQGSQEEGQKFDFDVVEQAAAQPVEQSSEQPKQQAQRSLSHEEIAWINTPGLQELDESEPPLQREKIIPAQAMKSTKPERGMPQKNAEQELLPRWAMRLLPVVALVLGQYVVAELLAIFVSWYDMHRTDFKRMQKKKRSTVRNWWIVGVLLLPVASLWIIAFVGAIRGGYDNLDAMVCATMLSALIAPAGLFGMYTSGKAKKKNGQKTNSKK